MPQDISLRGVFHYCLRDKRTIRYASPNLINRIKDIRRLPDHRWQIPPTSPRMVPMLRPDLEKPISSPTVSITSGEYDTIVVRFSRDLIVDNRIE
ncbi:hypothetical protein EPI10_020291 [Gossypium australe]|uniref:Uncharacterized protein n=1 Tax=Gossypium australe TaxID=47621 RepID=A0A5B6WDM8_9ROSI|nr:hypothetical protein EPI10_020291 [Gossypium australe]